MNIEYPKISDILKSNTFRVSFHSTEVSEFIVSNDKWERAVEDIKQRIRVKFNNDKFSSIIINQLARHILGIGEKFADEVHFYHTPLILDLLELYQNSKRGNVRPFNKNNILKRMGVQHIHHNANTFLLKNIQNFWKSKVKKSGLTEEEYQNQLLQIEYTKIEAKYPPEEAKKLALKIVLSNLQNENNVKPIANKTGEWVVFIQKENINYYLCLATHNEAKKLSDDIILQRIKPAILELKELQELALLIE